MTLRCVGLLGLLAIVGCDDGAPGILQQVDRPAATAPSNEPVPAAAAVPPAFDYKSELVLLPFDVRLAKVARVTGIEPDNALLKPLLDRRLDLGDSNYALGVKPDTSWTSARFTMWTKALKPVCASPAMHARYAALPENLPDLVLSAYGRRATADDRRIVDEALAGAPLDAAARYSVVCLCILSSLEFVAR